MIFLKDGRQPPWKTTSVEDDLNSWIEMVFVSGPQLPKEKDCTPQQISDTPPSPPTRIYLDVSLP